MRRVREIWAKLQDDGWTQQRLGEAMGYAPESARKSVSQWLKTNDPHISMLRKFASAAGVKIGKLVEE
jgi:transcriptional regulator with XRE-family HTH domain